MSCQSLAPAFASARNPMGDHNEKATWPPLPSAAFSPPRSSPPTRRSTSAVKTFDTVGNDAAKLKVYCEMSKVMSSADAEDDSKAEELDKQMDGFMKDLGPEFQTAFEAGADLDPESADGKTYDAAMDKLDDKCGK